MQASFDYAYAFTKKAEGGYCDHPDDKGGPTNYGISLATLKSLEKSAPDLLTEIGFTLPVSRETVKGMEPKQAKAIYKHVYWDAVNLGDYPQHMAAFMFDSHVNHGWKNAVRIFQRGYNKNLGVYGAPLSVDGICGPKTRTALLNAPDKTVAACIDARIDFYHSIVANNPSQQVFLKGWLNRMDGLRKYLGV